MTTLKPFGAAWRISPTLTMIFVDDGEQWHIASFTTKPEALAYLATLRLDPF
jgi:hypothetical protein